MSFKGWEMLLSVVISIQIKIPVVLRLVLVWEISVDDELVCPYWPSYDGPAAILSRDENCACGYCRTDVGGIGGGINRCICNGIKVEECRICFRAYRGLFPITMASCSEEKLVGTIPSVANEDPPSPFSPSSSHSSTSLQTSNKRVLSFPLSNAHKFRPVATRGTGERLSGKEIFDPARASSPTTPFRNFSFFASSSLSSLSSCSPPLAHHPKPPT
jgi:hypothetical protein